MRAEDCRNARAGLSIEGGGRCARAASRRADAGRICGAFAALAPPAAPATAARPPPLARGAAGG